MEELSEFVAAYNMLTVMERVWRKPWNQLWSSVNSLCEVGPWELSTEVGQEFLKGKGFYLISCLKIFPISHVFSFIRKMTQALLVIGLCSCMHAAQ